MRFNEMRNVENTRVERKGKKNGHSEARRQDLEGMEPEIKVEALGER